MKTRLLLLFLFVHIFFTQGVYAQCTPFWNEIKTFIKEDSANAPPPNAILFVGSSSFRMWKDVQEAFPAYPIINRGFGGSTLVDVIRYAYDIILPYHPKQILIYCGENDLSASDTVDAADVVMRFKTLYGIIRQNLPNTLVQFVSIKPSPSRSHLMPQMEKANEEIKQFLQKEQRAGFIDVYHSMLNEKGQPKMDIFLDDKLHMNRAGYAIWQKIIQPYLLK